MRYLIAKDSGKWRVYDDYRKEFAEHFDQASKKPEAKDRAQQMNDAYEKQSRGQ